MIRKLLLRGFSEAASKAEVADLQRLGLQSDRRFVESFIRARYHRGHGPVRIRFELQQQKAIDSGLIEQIMAELEIDWAQAIQTVCQRKYAGKPVASRSDYAKRWRFLRQRGFAPDQIKQVLDSL